LRFLEDLRETQEARRTIFQDSSLDSILAQ
jgi:hypothetical protein